MQDNRKGNAWVIVGIVVVVIAIAIFFFWKPQPSQAPSGGSTGTTAAVPPGTPSHAPQGQLVSELPRDLVLDSGAQITDSYSINYPGGPNQYTVTWNTTSSPAQILGEYQSYFIEHQMNITGSAGPTGAGVFALSGQGATSSVSIVVSIPSSVASVVLTYSAN